VEGYLAAVREACDRNGVLLILDEVMCGMGRTGTLHACKGENVVPDILVVAKGLGAGYQPIGAVLVARRVYDAMVAGSGFFQHGHTYTGHLAACAGALAVQKAIRDENLLDNVRRRGSELGDALTERFGNHRHIGDIRGRGLFFGLEFVADRASKRPFEARHRIASRLKYRALENGLICYPMGGVIDGREGDHVMLAPPFIIDGSHIAEMVDKLDRSVAQVLAEVGC
jgi:adenosylmethionine-8-amino-7-oxononanoate aminotransferase